MKRVFAILAAVAAAAFAGAGQAMADDEARTLLAANLFVGTLDDVTGFDGLPVPDGSYIEFRTMWEDMDNLYPPKSSWIETRNPLKATSEVGEGVIQSARGRGLFATCVPGLETGERYVARLFSGATAGESVAYRDSLPFTYAADATRAVTNVTFSSVWRATEDGQPLDATDSDGDGLSDFAERTQSATDPEEWDTDHDGFSDGFEYLHHMDPLEPYELAIQLDIVSPNDESWQEMGVEADQPLYSLTWAALSGRTYRVEYQPSMKPENPEDAWKFISDTTPDATTDQYIFHLEEMEDAGMYDWIAGQSAGFFRVSYTNDVSVEDEDPAGE